jgi:xanthine dehydrogenase YagR molybdenum-binding subunit
MTLVDESMRTVTFPAGVVGQDLQEVTRQIPADEPPPLAPNKDLAVIGKSIARHDARAKVTGAARFTVDVVLPGMLFGRILRSRLPHARVRAIDITAATRHPDVRAVILAVRPDDPSGSIVRYAGEPLAAVAATSMTAAEAALELIKVDYEALPFVVDLTDAQASTAPAVYDSASAPAGNPSGFPAPAGLPLHGNVRGPAIVRRGELSSGFAQAEVVVEEEYATQVQTHCCLEPHAIVADWRADGLTVYMSTQ